MLRHFLGAAVAGALITGALVGCTQQAPTTPPKAADTAPAKTVATTAPAAPSPSPAPKTAPAASPSPAAKTAAPAASPAAAAKIAVPTATSRTEPKGQTTYMFEASITPAWVDPQENPSIITPYFIQFALHDAVVKPLPGVPFAPSLAESYEIAPDYKSATFKLRSNAKFHNGEPVTAEDVKFTFENYRGANAKVLKDKTASIETPDPKTVKFNFKDPFLDFLIIYGTPASGAGWVVPKKYYQEVGPDGFKKNPIGAGPYKFVRYVGNDLELEAMPDYWRKSPNVKTLFLKGVPEAATRLAAIQTGEADFVNSMPGELIDTVRADRNLTLAPVLTPAPQWLEFPGWEDPRSPFNNIKVRQAINIGLNRQAIVDAETAGLAPLLTNWITPDMPGAIKGPAAEFDLARAKQLLAEAGFPNGFEFESLTPVPPRYSVGERLVTQLRELGIRGRVNQMERAAYATKITEGVDAFKGGILLSSSGAPGDAASRIRAYAVCTGSTSRTCLPEIDELFKKYEASTNPAEREKLLADIQKYILDNQIFVGLYQLVLPHVQGPKVANKWDEIWGAIPQYIYVGPYEDIQLK